MMDFKITTIIVTLLVTGALFGFALSNSYYKKESLMRCKHSGWAFIDEVLIFAPNTDGQNIRRNFYANLATKCITYELNTTP